MPTFEVARSMILASVSSLGAERVELLAALGRVVAEDVVAPWDMPFYDNSAMDGFAVRTADCRRAAPCGSPAISRKRASRDRVHV